MDGFVKAGFADVKSGSVFNIGSTEEVSINQLKKQEKVAKLVGEQTLIETTEGYFWRLKKAIARHEKCQ